MADLLLKTFIIYAREDADAILQLKKPLALLEKQGKIAVWYDGEIIAGQEWEKAIKLHLESADIILLLLSNDFFVSEYIEKKELQEALARHERGESVVVPVILYDCMWDEHPEIVKLQVLPQNANPVFSRHWFDSNEAFTDVARGVFRTANALLEKHRQTEIVKVDKAMWDIAFRNATIEGFEKYLEKAENRIHRDEASKRLKILKEEKAQQADETAWQTAQRADCIEGFEEYLKRAENQIHRAKANARLKTLKEEKRKEEARQADERAWRTVKRANSLESFEKYLANTENQIHRDEASKRLKILKEEKGRRADERAWQTAFQADSIKGLEKYLANAENQIHREEASERLKILKEEQARQADEMAWQTAQQANSIEAIEKYLSKTEHQIHRAKANARLKTLKEEKRKEEMRQADETAWQIAQRANNLESFERYLSNTEHQLHRTEAYERLKIFKEEKRQWESRQADEAAWHIAQRTNSIESIEKYLSKTEHEIHRDKANARLKILKEEKRKEEAKQAEAAAKAIEAEKARKIRESEFYEKYKAALAHEWASRFLEAKTAFQQALALHEDSFAVSKNILQYKISVAEKAIEVEQRREAEAAEQKRKIEEAERLKGLLEMVFVKGGTFIMGSPENEEERETDERQHQVTLSDFEIGKYPVTQKLWCEIMGNNPSLFKGDNLPVENVDWGDCQQFLEELNERFPGKKYRLPTESEWEFAARGGTLSKGYKYAGSNDLNEVGWFSENSGKKNHPVGQKKANELGLYDMSGNVCEWCEDWYGAYPMGATTNPKGPSSESYHVLRILAHRVRRGGSWADFPKLCRLTHRFNWGDRNYYVKYGFRLAMTP